MHADSGAVHSASALPDAEFPTDEFMEHDIENEDKRDLIPKLRIGRGISSITPQSKTQSRNSPSALRPARVNSFVCDIPQPAGSPCD
jgi:hypothetical protein